MNREVAERMKHSGTCSKCGSGKIACVPEGAFAGYHGVMVTLSAFTGVRAACIICCSCGHTELWMPEDKLGRIYKKYGCSPERE